MSNTPLVKTSGRAQRRRGAARARRAGTAWRRRRQHRGDCRLRGSRRGAAPRLAPVSNARGDSTMLTLCGFADLELLQQGQAGAAREGRRLRRGARRTTGSSDEAVLGARRSARSRSSAPSTARCARARRSSTTSRPPGPSRRCCRPTPGPRAKVRELVDLRRPAPRTGRARALREGLLRRRRSATATRRASASCSSKQHRRLQAAGEVRALRRRRHASPRPTARPTSACRWSRWRAGSIYGEDLLAAGGIDWKAYAKLIGERPSAQKRGGRPQGRAGRSRRR